MQISRRTALAGLLATGAIYKSHAKGGAQMLQAEWSPHSGCVMALCDAASLYGRQNIAKMQREQVRIATSIARFEPVTMLVNHGQRNLAADLFPASISIVELAHYDVWARDTMPTIVRTASGNQLAVDWNFNVWGEKYFGYKRDRSLAKKFSSHQKLPRVTAAITLEGGAIEVDGQGTLVTTETCLLNRNRNPGMTKGDIEDELRRQTGASKIVWLYGSEIDTITNGHIDGAMRFIRPGVAVVEVTDDRQDLEYHELQENLTRLRAARDAQGNRFEIHQILRPRWDIMPDRGDYFASSYVNAYFPNGGIVMSKFGDPDRDKAAHDLFQKLEPNRKIIQIDVSDICEQGGGIHCNTMQIPA